MLGCSRPEHQTGLRSHSLHLGGCRSYVIAHIIVRRFASRADPLILPLAAALNFLGLAVIYRLSPHRFGPSQVTWTLVGVALFIATLLLLRDYTVLSRYKYLAGFAGVGSAAASPHPARGHHQRGASLGAVSRRLPAGGARQDLPGPVLAGYLAERKELLAIASRRVFGFHVPDLKHFGPLLVMWGLSLAVMFYENDMGSSRVLFDLHRDAVHRNRPRRLFSLWWGVVRHRRLLRLPGIRSRAGACNHLAARLQSASRQQPELPVGTSLFALATGGLFGTGPGQGRPDLIPAAHTDFLFSAVGEEWDSLARWQCCSASCFWSRAVSEPPSSPGTSTVSCLAAGLMTIFGIQTFVIVAGVTRLLPLTGVTPPFMSYGGSSLLANFVLIGLLVRMSHQTANEPTPAHTAEILVGGRR